MWCSGYRLELAFRKQGIGLGKGVEQNTEGKLKFHLDTGGNSVDRFRESNAI